MGLAFDANGLTPILAADSAPLSSVGLGHGSVIFQCNTVTPAPTSADSSHDVARPANDLSRRDFHSLQETLPASTIVCHTTQIEDTSASPGRVQGARVGPTLWDTPSAAVSKAPTMSDTPGTTIATPWTWQFPPTRSHPTLVAPDTLRQRES